jgi:hypothetical protein
LSELLFGGSVFSFVKHFQFLRMVAHQCTLISCMSNLRASAR